MVWCSHLYKNFPQFVVIHTVKGLGIVNIAKVNVILEFTVNILLKPGLENFEDYFASM